MLLLDLQRHEKLIYNYMEISSLIVCWQLREIGKSDDKIRRGKNERVFVVQGLSSKYNQIYTLCIYLYRQLMFIYIYMYIEIFVELFL